MDSQKNEQLVARLEELDSQSVRFYDAKQILLSEGYSDKEITAAVYAFPYDGRPNATIPQGQPAKDPYGRSAIQSTRPIIPDITSQSSGKWELVHYILLRLIAALGVLDNVLFFLLRPYPIRPEEYRIEYWACGVMVAIIVLAVCTRSIKATRSNVMMILVGLVGAGGLFMIARGHETIVKSYSTQQCSQMMRSINTDSLQTTDTLPPPNLGLPAACLRNR